MSAFLIFHGTIIDADKFSEYAQAVPATLSPFDGSITLRGKADSVLCGKHQHAIIASLRFPDLQSAHGWYHSPAYQALIPKRDQAADFTVISYEALD
ncbi:MAG TPA: DUF1330 domain-containing protein [Bacteroidetes bacterium]|nr:DUF1330 domain-containing protein [Bacteroidota bacterium]